MRGRLVRLERYGKQQKVRMRSAELKKRRQVAEGIRLQRFGLLSKPALGMFQETESQARNRRSFQLTSIRATVPGVEQTQNRSSILPHFRLPFWVFCWEGIVEIGHN